MHAASEMQLRRESPGEKYESQILTGWTGNSRLSRRLDGHLAVMGTGLQESALDQMPKEHGCKADERQAGQKKNGWVESSNAKRDQGLQNRPMHDVHAIREIAVFGEVAEIAPEPEYEDQSRDPENIENVSGEKVVCKKQACCNARNGQEVEFELVEVEQEQDAGHEIYELSWKLDIEFFIDASRGVN